MNLSPDKFNDWLERIGQDIMWRKADMCPCVSVTSGAAAVNCPVCNGKGAIWANEIRGRVGIQGIKNNKGFSNFGEWMPGDTLLTIGSDAPCYVCGQYDRFRLLNSVSAFRTVVVPGFNDKLLGTIKSISRAFWLNDDGSAIVEGTIPTVADDGSISWANSGPPTGRSFSISGERYDEFYIYMALPSNRNEHAGAALPKKLPVRKFDVFGR